MCTIKTKCIELASLRIKKGLSLNQLARSTKLNSGVISRIESGAVSPRPETAKKICEALGVEFDTIFSITQ